MNSSASSSSTVRVVLGTPGRVRVTEDFESGRYAPRILVRRPGSRVEWAPPEEKRDGAETEGDVYGDLPAGPLEIVARHGETGEFLEVRTVEVVAGKTVERAFGRRAATLAACPDLRPPPRRSAATNSSRC